MKTAARTFLLLGTNKLFTQYGNVSMPLLIVLKEPSGQLSASEGLKIVVGNVVGVLVPEDEQDGDDKHDAGDNEKEISTGEEKS